MSKKQITGAHDEPRAELNEVARDRRLHNVDRDHLVDRARRYSIPGWFGERSARDTLRQYLLWLCSHLDSLLEHPAVWHDEGDTRTVIALGCVAYRVDSTARCVTPGRWRNGGDFEPGEFVVELGMPLTTRAWLPWLIEELGIAGKIAQDDLITDDEWVSYFNNWLVDITHRLLRQDPRFRRLRREVLPRAFRLDKELIGIALAARPKPLGGSLTSSVYNVVWRHEQAFRQVARENRQLLPLLYLCIEEGRVELRRDPVQELRNLLMNAGLSKAAWRYLCRYGMRYVGMILWHGRGKSRVDIVIEYLETLEKAGFPPPPTERMLRALFWAMATAVPENIGRGWCVIPRDALGISLRASVNRRDSHKHQVYLEQLATVLDWAVCVRPVLDKNQRHAGWPWLCRSAETWDRQWLEQRLSDPRRWESAVAEYQDGAFKVVPLTTASALVEEGREMMNCLADYVGHCAESGVRVFSIRRADSGKRLAVASICTLSDDPDYWYVTDVKGPANGDPGPLSAIASGIAHRYSAAIGRTRHPETVDQTGEAG